MITRKSRYEPASSWILPEDCQPDTSVFFDIETTGFCPERSQLYLIGVLYYSGKEWFTVQWMSENSGEEAALLRIFEVFLRPYQNLIHFNGDRFDIPYLRARYQAFHLADPFDVPGRSMHDMFRTFRKLKKLLSLNHCNQKSLECFLGLSRKDSFHGGELIPVYKSYCVHPEEELLSSLLLHNREDLTGMLSLTALFSYLPLKDFSEDSRLIRDTIQGKLVPADKKNHETGQPYESFAEDQSLPQELQIRFQLPDEIPVKLCRQTGSFNLSAMENTVLLTVPILCGKLKYYFPNSQEYYYLPAEDQAIHKSVAVFVDPSHRVKATADTCYICREGLFLPHPYRNGSLQVFRTDRKDPVSFFPLPDDVLETPFLMRYTRQLLSVI